MTVRGFIVIKLKVSFFSPNRARCNNDAGRLLRGPLYATGTKDVPHYNDTEKNTIGLANLIFNPALI